MLVMTAKVSKKMIAAILAAIAVVTIGLILLKSTPAPAGGNDERVSFLSGFGWEVSPTPTESGQVRIPQEPGEVFVRYNQLQQSQGYDLSAYAGKTVMRYVYQVTNYPGASDPVYATVLVSSGQVIGGDITDTSAAGKVQGFSKSS